MGGWVVQNYPSPMLNIWKFAQNSLKKSKIHTFEENFFFIDEGRVVQNYSTPMRNIWKFAQNSLKKTKMRTFEEKIIFGWWGGG